MNLFTTNIPSFPAGLKVLAVDHDTDDLFTIHHICNRLRYQVTTCCSISEAMDHLFQQGFDIILIETHIPHQDTYAFVHQMTSLLKIPVIMMSVDNQPCSVMNSISNGACSYWTKPLHENLFKNMWQHVVRNAFIQTDPHQLIETKGLKKRGRDDDHVSKLPLAKKTRLEAKGLKKQGRDDVDVSKQPLAKKTRLSWTLDLHQKFLSAVNHLGINNAGPKKILKIMDCPGLTLGHVASHLQKYRKYLKGGIKKSKLNEFELPGQKDNETQYSMTAQDQCHDKSPAEQNWTEIDESDIFFDLTDLFPDFNDDIHNLMQRYITENNWQVEVNELEWDNVLGHGKNAIGALEETLCKYLITNFSDFQLACLGSFFLHESVFFLSGLPFVWIERAGWLSKYKIQAKNNSPAAQDRCIGRLLLYHFGVKIGVPCYVLFLNIILTQIMFYFILEDFIFYWGHRILHTKWLYKHVHSVHHEYATPFGLTSEYAHPAEILFLGFATIFGPAITGPHLITLWLWMVLRVLETGEAHSGYHFPWSPSNFFPLYGGTDFHDYHHRLLYTKSGNYSSTFTYMDRIFGTDVGYRKLKALKNSEFEDSYEQKKQ
ncbi:sterol 4-alpha-methyl-oxidase 2-2 [Trifolium repens]|nr:sterol 4-alpha-methyl-oxidase 2-2 [Trifolium repens]